MRSTGKLIPFERTDPLGYIVIPGDTTVHTIGVTTLKNVANGSLPVTNLGDDLIRALITNVINSTGAVR